MEFKKPFEPINESPTVPSKLIDRVQEWHTKMLRVEVLRLKKGGGQAKVNEIRLRISPEGHPEEDVVEIAEAITNCAEWDCEDKGSIFKYKALLWVKEGNAELKKPVTFQPELDYAEDESTEDSRISSDAVTGAFEMAKSAMAIGRGELITGLSNANSHILELQDRLLEHSKHSGKAFEGAMKMNEGLMNRLDDAMIQKDRALSMIYAHKKDEMQAETDLKTREMVTGMLKPAFMILASQLGAKFGLDPSMFDMPEEDDETGEGEEKQGPPTTDETSEQYEARKKREDVLKNMRERPVATQLKTLNDSIDMGQWHRLYAVLPLKLLDLFKTGLQQTGEEVGLSYIGKFGANIMVNPALLDKLNTVLNNSQRTLVMRLFKMAVAKAGAGQQAPKEPTPAPPAAEDSADGADDGEVTDETGGEEGDEVTDETDGEGEDEAPEVPEKPETAPKRTRKPRTKKTSKKAPKKKPPKK